MASIIGDSVDGCEVGVFGVYIGTVLWFYGVTVLRFYSVTLLQHYSVTVLKCKC